RHLGRPELLNRLGGNIVVFDPIVDQPFRDRILRIKTEPLLHMLRERYGIGLHLTEPLRQHYLKCARAEHGGRRLVNALERNLCDPLARFLFAHKHQLRSGRVLNADLVGDRVEFEIREN
ncbi:MAG: hypothetical protein IID41_09965, partial [Planctomycetes bacterium]|nr:hypothetical protein [Planctomycetota bacterium]